VRQHAQDPACCSAGTSSSTRRPRSSSRPPSRPRSGTVHRPGCRAGARVVPPTTPSRCSDTGSCPGRKGKPPGSLLCIGKYGVALRMAACRRGRARGPVPRHRRSMFLLGRLAIREARTWRSPGDLAASRKMNRSSSARDGSPAYPRTATPPPAAATSERTTYQTVSMSRLASRRALAAGYGRPCRPWPGRNPACDVILAASGLACGGLHAYTGLSQGPASE
jgi:hypothetical protein